MRTHVILYVYVIDWAARGARGRVRGRVRGQGAGPGAGARPDARAAERAHLDRGAQGERADGEI